MAKLPVFTIQYRFDYENVNYRLDVGHLDAAE